MCRGHEIASVLERKRLSRQGQVRGFIAKRVWRLRTTNGAVDCRLKQRIAEMERHIPNCNLLHNNFSVEAAKQLVEAAKQSKTLKSLCGKAGEKQIDLRALGLQDPDAILISFDVAFNAALLELHLQGNYIGDAGCAALAEALKSAALQSCNLLKNSFSWVDFIFNKTHLGKESPNILAKMWMKIIELKSF